VKLSTHTEAVAFIKHLGINYYDKLPAFESYFPYSVTYSITSQEKYFLSLARSFFLLFDNYKEIIFLITEWGVWPSSEDMNLFYRFRKSFGFDQKLIEYPAHVLSKNEQEDIITLIYIGLMSGWDFYLLPDSKEFAVSCNHDEFICVHGVDSEKLIAFDKKASEVLRKV